MEVKNADGKTAHTEGSRMATLKTMTEKELREFAGAHPKSLWQLFKVIWTLTRRQHDYGTCVYAMSISSEATFNYIAHKLGVTGFQASCADLDFLGRIRHMRHGFRIINYDDLLYPQYRERVQEAGNWEKLLADNKDSLRERANKMLIESPNAHPNVKAHWERLAQAS